VSRRREWVPVAVWELQRLLKRKDFLVWVALGPVVIGAVIGGISWFKQREAKEITRIAVVQLQRGGAVAPVALPPLEGIEWIAPPPAARDTAALAQGVRRKEWNGALVLAEHFPDSGRVEAIVYRERPGWRDRVNEHLLRYARHQRAARYGLGSEQIERLEASVTLLERPADPARRTSGSDRGFAVLTVMLTLMGLFVVNSYLAIGITGEKQARVTEVVVSAIRPQSWMDGKIVAYTLIGLVQILIWVATLVVAVVVIGRELPMGMEPLRLLLLGTFMVLGLALYVSLWALVLATIKDIQSTSKFQAYLIFMPIVPFMFLESLMQNPDGPLAVTFSLFPFFSPFVVPLRLALKSIPPWEVASALALLAVTAHFLRLAAGQSFRIGMLMYGKELSLPELWRWARRP